MTRAGCIRGYSPTYYLIKFRPSPVFADLFQCSFNQIATNVDVFENDWRRLSEHAKESEMYKTTMELEGNEIENYEMYEINDVVFDGPSQQETTIVEISIVTNDPDDKDSGVYAYHYRVDDNVPLDPTGDEAFPDRWRCDFEICAPADKATLIPFSY
jgi:hypothetical protein